MNTPVPKIGKTNIEIVKGNGLANLILHAHTDDEICLTISDKALAILTDRLASLGQKDQGYDMMLFDLYANYIPIEVEGEDADDDKFTGCGLEDCGQ